MDGAPRPKADGMNSQWEVGGGRWTEDSGIESDIREVLLVGHLRLVRPDRGDGDAGNADVEAVSGERADQGE
jgi:hypothetical protein